MSTSTLHKAIFLDKDGTVLEDVPYNVDPARMRLAPGAGAGLRLLQQAGYRLIVVTNQSGVARGFYSEAAVKLFNSHLQELLKAEGAHIDAFYYCPHHPDGKIKELAIRCHCRKPQPGMLEQAARDWPIDLARSFLIGDKDDDMAAARAFHIRGVKFDAQAGTLEDLVRKELAPRVGL